MRMPQPHPHVCRSMPQLDLKDLFEQSVYISRLYVTRGIKLAARDSNGLSDPYLVVRNGPTKQEVWVEGVG